ncbi:MAG: DNA alkylation repair protein [Xanthomonadales bacterium]|nr:DNA alkylation repair protein [Xanthomonadales bacterium]
MANVDEIMQQLADLGSTQTLNIYRRHGAPDNSFGVKVGAMKPLAKRFRGEQETALALYDTGNGDAQYFAGLIAKPKAFTQVQLNHWAQTATWYMVAEYTVPRMTVNNAACWPCIETWLDHTSDSVRATGWTTMGSYTAITADEQLDLASLSNYLLKVQNDIHSSTNRTRYAMNQFVISIGCYVRPLHEEALAVAKAIGKVKVDLGKTACKVPQASTYIEKVATMNRVGKKQKPST